MIYEPNALIDLSPAVPRI